MARNPTSSDGPPTYARGTTWLNTSTYDEFELTDTGPVTWTLVGSHQLAVQYLPCTGSAGGTPNFSASSNADLVTMLGGTRLSSALANHVGVGSAPDWNWPNPICRLRVWTRESHRPVF